MISQTQSSILQVYIVRQLRARRGDLLEYTGLLTLSEGGREGVGQFRRLVVESLANEYTGREAHAFCCRMKEMLLRQ